MRPLIGILAVGTAWFTAIAGVAPAAAASATTYVIGVDNAGPAGHDYEYVDYFPRSGVNVHRGDILDFKWNSATLDGLHTVTFNPSQAMQAGLAIPEPILNHGDEGALQINPFLLNASNPGCGSSAAGACSYTSGATLNSGAIFNQAGGDFFVKVDVGPGTLNYVCLIHSGMSGSVNVVSDATPASTPTQVQDAAASQLASDTVGARQVEAQAQSRSVATNPDGTHTVTITAGTATPYVEVAEMLPEKVTVRPGDTVTWVTKTLKDPHTVTFPQGDSRATDPAPTFCENTPEDIPAPLTFPEHLPSFGCANPASAEVHLVPFPIGGTVISSPTTEASSGIISAAPPPGDRYSFSFPNSGVYTYQCRIHDNMVGVVTVTGT